MLVVIAVAAASLALTCAAISAVQSMLEDVDVPVVVKELEALEVAAADVALLTEVMIEAPVQRGNGPAGGAGRLSISDQPKSLSRYCGIWFAADSAETAAWVLTSAEDSVACSAAISTSVMAEFADSRFCDWVEIELALKLKRDSWAPIVARAADTELIAVSSVVSA